MMLVPAIAQATSSQEAIAKVLILSLSTKKKETTVGGLYEIHTLFCMIIIHQATNRWVFQEKEYFCKRLKMLYIIRRTIRYEIWDNTRH